MSNPLGLVRPPQRPKPNQPNSTGNPRPPGNNNDHATSLPPPNFGQNVNHDNNNNNTRVNPSAPPPIPTSIPPHPSTVLSQTNPLPPPVFSNVPPPVQPHPMSQQQNPTPNFPHPKIPPPASKFPPPNMSNQTTNAAKLPPPVIPAGLNSSLPAPISKFPPPFSQPAEHSNEQHNEETIIEKKPSFIPPPPARKKAPAPVVASSGITFFSAQNVPPPLELTKEEEDMVIEMPENIPSYPERFLPVIEFQELPLPESINNHSNITSSLFLFPSLNLADNITEVHKSGNLPSDRKFEDLVPIPSAGIKKSKSNPMIYEPNTSIPNLFSSQQKVVTSDPYGSLILSAQTAVGLANANNDNLPEGKEEEEKREKRKNRVGRSYPIVEDDQFPNPVRHEYLDLYEPLSSLIDLQGCSFIEYAKKYFKEQKSQNKIKMSQKKPVQFSSLISHTKKIYSPLHSFESKELQKQAMDLFDRLKYYMTDKKTLDKQSNLDPMTVVQQYLDLVLSTPALHDEVYAHIIKQLCNNPSKTSEAKGWEFLTYVICTFPPTNIELRQSLSNWLLDQTTRLPDAAWFCSHCLQRTLSRGNITRKKGPSLIELQYLRDRNPIICRISCFDGTQKAITIDSSVTIEKVFHSFCDRIQLDFCYRDFFKMFIILANSERQIRLEVGLIVDCLRSVELFYSYHSNKLDLSNAKLFIKQKIFLKRKQPIQSELLNRLLFHQVKADILSGLIPCNQEKDIINLTALLLQHELGDYDESSIPKIDQYLPHKVAGQKNDIFWWEKIKSCYFSMMATSKDQCRKKYVAIAQKLQFYGTSFYDIDLINADQYNNMEGKKLAISEDGLFIYTEDLLKLVVHYKFEDIARWATKPESNTFEIQTNTQPLYLSTKLYSEIIKELNCYISSMLARARTAIANVDHEFANTEENKDLLPFKKGDVLRIYVPDDGNNWEYGSDSNGKTGNFPAKLVKRVWVK